MSYGDYGNYSRSSNIDWSGNTLKNIKPQQEVQLEQTAGQTSSTDNTVSEEELLEYANFYAGMGLNISPKKKYFENAATVAMQTLSDAGYNPDEIKDRLDQSMPKFLAYINANDTGLSKETETGFFAELDNIADALAA